MRIEFGSAERIKEEVRDVRLGRWLEVLRQDLHYGFRVLRAHPGITAIARLATGVSTQTAEAALDTAARARDAPQPDVARRFVVRTAS